MAKVRHRTFEMYELRDEAVTALTGNSARTAVEKVDPGLWTFQHFVTSRSDGITLVLLKETEGSAAEVSSKIRDELSLMVRSLDHNSRVVMDFEGVSTFSSESIEALTRFNQTLISKGSQLALCNLSPDVQAAFFPNRK